MRPIVLATALFLAAACALPAARADEALAGDLAKVQGKWKGMMVRDQAIPVLVEIQGSKATVTITRPTDSQTFVLKGEIKIDEKASLKQWDWVKFSTPDGQEMPDNLGIYQLSGEDLTIYNGGPGNPRPSAFKAGEDGSPSVLKLTRATEEKLEGDLAKVQGKWKGLVGRENNVPIVLEVKGSSASITATRPTDSQTVVLKGEIKLDEKASPKRWDWVKFKTPDGQEMPDNLGINQLAGEDLTICNGGPGNPRPGELKAGADGPPNLLKLSRIK
jgi:uncharacterized protein (TIGR03067 family)